MLMSKDEDKVECGQNCDRPWVLDRSVMGIFMSSFISKQAGFFLLFSDWGT
jgi:hypothetical protein